MPISSRECIWAPCGSRRNRARVNQARPSASLGPSGLIHPSASLRLARLFMRVCLSKTGAVINSHSNKSMFARGTNDRVGRLSLTRQHTQHRKQTAYCNHGRAPPPNAPAFYDGVARKASQQCENADQRPIYDPHHPYPELNMRPGLFRRVHKRLNQAVINGVTRLQCFKIFFEVARHLPQTNLFCET